jgi:predicted RNA methylase
MILQAAEFGDIEKKVVLDLGCGPGILGISASLLNCRHVFFLV